MFRSAKGLIAGGLMILKKKTVLFIRKTFDFFYKIKLFSPNFLSNAGIEKSLKKILTENNANLILDLGCGNSPYNFFFLNNKYIGLDNSKNSNADIISNIESIPVKNESVDTILLLEVLEHIDNIDKLLGECFRVLKKKGEMIVSIPFMYNAHSQNDYIRFTIKGFRNKVSLAGFEIKKQICIGNLVVTFILHLQYLLFFIIPERFPLFRYIFFVPIVLLFFILNIIGYFISFNVENQSTNYMFLIRKSN